VCVCVGHVMLTAFHQVCTCMHIASACGLLAVPAAYTLCLMLPRAPGFELTPYQLCAPSQFLQAGAAAVCPTAGGEGVAVARPKHHNLWLHTHHSLTLQVLVTCWCVRLHSDGPH
jgi:hypothetical protein